uniref:Mitochondrial import inner membrane translocase subunit n=1 Tax=Albugo laibachii Nc14 TaxID=890382 RepID=F0W0J4_9STRA|nr:Mitochondrial Protein Translocase (MPT) Family puta [Albugo laibachii Nc14]|eukprot:CCA14566.1 Mitochondrial Protein Translocase (MPT) Family puta [Albugo laibachii Nc14]
MPFFGFGKGKETETDTSYGYDEPTYDYTSPMSDGSSSSLSGSNLGSTSNRSATIQAIILEEQQRALIQHAIQKVTAIAWDKCSSSKPDSELSSRESECIKHVTLAYLDTSRFVGHRLMKGFKS